MAVADDNGRISVSKDFLRAELGLMELRLVDKLATKAEVDDLARRVMLLEAQDSPTRIEFDALRAWHLAVKGALAVLIAVALAALPMLIRHYTG